MSERTEVIDITERLDPGSQQNVGILIAGYLVALAMLQPDKFQVEHIRPQFEGIAVGANTDDHNAAIERFVKFLGDEAERLTAGRKH